MNKIAVLVLTVVAACCVQASAQGIARLANAEAKMDQQIANKNKEQVENTLEAKANQIAAKTMKSIQSADVTDQEAVLLAGKKATKVLELVQLNNPKYEKEMGYVIASHNNLLNANAVSKDRNLVIQHFYLQQENLESDIKALAKKDAKLAKTVHEIVNHAYWINVQQKGYDLKGIIYLAHETFPMLPWTDDELK